MDGSRSPESLPRRRSAGQGLAPTVACQQQSSPPHFSYSNYWLGYSFQNENSSLSPQFRCVYGRRFQARPQGRFYFDHIHISLPYLHRFASASRICRKDAEVRYRKTDRIAPCCLSFCLNSMHNDIIAAPAFRIRFHKYYSCDTARYDMFHTVVVWKCSNIHRAVLHRPSQPCSVCDGIHLGMNHPSILRYLPHPGLENRLPMLLVR